MITNNINDLDDDEKHMTQDVSLMAKALSAMLPEDTLFSITVTDLESRRTVTVGSYEPDQLRIVLKKTLAELENALQTVN